MKYFGFFKGMKYGKCEDDFDSYRKIRNNMEKSRVLKYIKSLPIAGVAPMTTEDIFSGEVLEQAGIIEDGDFAFPIDFIHYYENYDIGIPTDYEDYILEKHGKMRESILDRI